MWRWAVQAKYPNAIANVRGQGTLVAFDAATPAAQVRFFRYR
jgi:hypothetical protein